MEGVEKHVHTSCSVREIFSSFILWTPAEAEPTMAAAAIKVLFMMGDLPECVLTMNRE